MSTSGFHLWETHSEGKGACCEMCFLVAAGSGTDHLGFGGGKMRNECLVHKPKNAYKYNLYFSLFGEYYVDSFTKIIRLL